MPSIARPILRSLNDRYSQVLSCGPLGKQLLTPFNSVLQQIARGEEPADLTDPEVTEKIIASMADYH